MGLYEIYEAEDLLNRKIMTVYCTDESCKASVDIESPYHITMESYDADYCWLSIFIKIPRNGVIHNGNK